MNLPIPNIPPLAKSKKGDKKQKEKDKKEYLDQLLPQTFKKEYFNRK